MLIVNLVPFRNNKRACALCRPFDWRFVDFTFFIITSLNTRPHYEHLYMIHLGFSHSMKYLFCCCYYGSMPICRSFAFFLFNNKERGCLVGTFSLSTSQDCTRNTFFFLSFFTLTDWKDCLILLWMLCLQFLILSQSYSLEVKLSSFIFIQDIYIYFFFLWGVGSLGGAADPSFSWGQFNWGSGGIMKVTEAMTTFFSRTGVSTEVNVMFSQASFTAMGRCWWHHAMDILSQFQQVLNVWYVWKDVWYHPKKQLCFLRMGQPDNWPFVKE